MNNLYKFITTRRGITILICLIVIAFVGSYVRFLEPSLTYRDMLNPNLPQLIAYENIQKNYTHDDNIQVILASNDKDVFNKETLIVIDELTTKLWKTPFSTRVDSLTNFQNTTSQNDDLLVAALLEDTSAITDKTINNIKNVALTDPALKNRLVSKSGKVTSINVSLFLPNEEMNEKIDAVDFVRALIGEIEKENPDMEFHISGSVTFDETAMKVSGADTGMFLAITFIIVLVFLFFIFRNFSVIIPSMLVILSSMVCGMAFGGIMGWKLTPMSSPIPLMILILAVADCVHVITSFLQNMRKGMVKTIAMLDSLKLNFAPIAATSITTAIGFLTMNFSHSDSIAAMGNQVAFGVMIAFVLSVTLLPAMVCLFPVKVKVTSKPTSNKQQWYIKFIEFLDRSKLIVLISSIVLVVGLGYGASRNIVNDKFHTYFSEDTPFRQAIEFTDKHIGGTYNISYSIDSGSKNGISDPKFLSKLEAFVTWLRSQSEVIQVYALSDTLKRINKSMHSDKQSEYQLPDDKNLIAQYILLYELSLPLGLDLNDQVNFDKSATRIQVSLESLSTLQMLEFEKRAASWFSENIHQTGLEGSSVQIMFSHMARTDVNNMIQSTVIALVFISLLLIFVFKSFRIGIISLVPNLLPAISAFGIWGLLVGEIGLGLAMVSGMTMGIMVDDTIHFLSKYQRARTLLSLGTKAAIEYAYEKAGYSILITSVVLIAGFYAMTFAQFRVNSDLGLMTALVILLALIFDFILLPVLLMIFDKPKTITEKEKIGVS